jgi:hypothetical protein
MIERRLTSQHVRSGAYAAKSVRLFIGASIPTAPLIGTVGVLGILETILD